MFGSALCAYPWDIVDDDAAARRFAATGVDRVLLAAAYHGVRASTPQHPKHRLVTADHSALYMPARPEVWANRRFAPRAPGAWAPGDTFGEARDALMNAGVQVGAWLVLTHDDYGIRQSPDVTDVASDVRVRNAFGDVLSHALCPAAPDVVAYACGLVEEAAARGVTEIMLEAVGQMGAEHFGAHDKTTGADWSEADAALLSICFCDACRSELNAGGLDTARVADAIRSSVGTGKASVAAAIGEDSAATVLAHRHAASATLLDAAVETARRGGVTRVSVHTGLEPWGTSSFSSFAPGPLPVDDLVLSEATASRLLRDDIAALHQERGGRVSAYVSAMPPAAPQELSDRWGGLLEQGVDDLIVYHGGLLSAPRLRAVTHTLRALRGA
ncbi:hypothetical protein [Microbacterium sp. CH1]|uniref:hypothetical protein n=1 Tax=Microbacterium sp. CH1 TaxID=1770208 RepID=UPI0007898C11|nr:hypothetical protein [Microbacterium sp. CH1]KYJ98870.1 hypothetical protein AUV07_08310 [Microbacterium sp. CH1]